MASLPQYKKDFLSTCMSAGILKFGTFTLKSGRESPYFFNAGSFYTASLLRALSTAYARCLLASPAVEFDILFGPAYKGIPLATSTVDKLGELAPERYADLCYSFDRKEVKDHGEGGGIVGAPLKGKRVLIVDDVVTAGTAKREAIGKIRGEGGVVVGILVALDRMETVPGDEGGRSAIGMIGEEFGVPVLSILSMDDIIGALGDKEGGEGDRKRMVEYRERFGAKV
ncbi:PRTase-like protein [Glarea lozoyensis ATCC 20868]|uniref:Orotate phosphoribosyltransferase n=1 Tax=Glarea lozoyensis (strain ATCC 20868 / MF5171) TaxID=1116229 RepID=S3CYJ7_GLAL2|nr:PRTase-like protein [Glarea lozoyensis ATCC 20868]EPE31342.1 PRTase-like protein [Glarea lozoyensis ATCC 20868]